MCCFGRGKKTIDEVCRFTKARKIFAIDPSIVPLGVETEELILVSQAVMQKMSGVQTPEGVLAIVNMPKNGDFKGFKRVLGLDGINDPGNLGTLLRTALALGWEGVFLLPGCADPFNDKALRAAKGAPFRLPIKSGSWEELEKLGKSHHLESYAADLEGVFPGDVPLKKGILLVLGSESHGLSLAAAKNCQKVTIPMPGMMESLNVGVAGGILMYLLRKG